MLALRGARWAHNPTIDQRPLVQRTLYSAARALHFPLHNSLGVFM
jgi:hypothetical protein